MRRKCLSTPHQPEYRKSQVESQCSTSRILWPPFFVAAVHRLQTAGALSFESSAQRVPRSPTTPQIVMIESPRFA